MILADNKLSAVWCVALDSFHSRRDTRCVHHEPGERERSEPLSKHVVGTTRYRRNEKLPGEGLLRGDSTQISGMFVRTFRDLATS